MTQQLMLKETQADRVLDMLRDSEIGVCAVEFLQARIPRFGGRIFDLRRAGHVIENRRCNGAHLRAQDSEHLTRQVRYVLIQP